MPKVIRRIRGSLQLVGLILALWPLATGQSAPVAAAPTNSAQQLYLQLRSVGLDKSRVYHARHLSFSRDAVQISFADGMIAFTEDVEGRVTGAFFEGDGEILMMPPNQVERASMQLFTGAAILEEKFASAYFRFNDNTYDELRPQLEHVDQGADFVARLNPVARDLAAPDALRLLLTFSRLLPSGARSPGASSPAAQPDDRMLHARVEGEHLGAFDVFYDSTLPESVRAGQLNTVQGENYYDVWTSIATQRASHASGDSDGVLGADGTTSDTVEISDFKIRAEVKPPTQLEAEATLQISVRKGGQRALLFELSRFLEIKQVDVDGKPIEFIQNPALDGSQLARRGDDLVAVVFPQALRAGERMQLHFAYRGEVLSEAGVGLLYVGARGTWYPNRGPAMAHFDLEFKYPAGWTLVATGTRREGATLPAGDELQAKPAGAAAGELSSRWVSEQPIPFAGFNLGKYTSAVAHAGDVEVQAYATSGVERGFPSVPTPVAPSIPGAPTPQAAPAVIAVPLSPAGNEQLVANDSAHAVEFFAHRFGPYPYGQLALAQIPGTVSQGWPGLIFLSSFAYLNPQQKADLHMGSLESARAHAVIAHETAHQWWGDLVGWKGYRDQWIVEALAEYSSMMLLESEDPAKFHEIMEYDRDNLLLKNKDGMQLMDAGPVTLGARLSCSKFPDGYEAISYGRGVWLFHMLRMMMRDAEAKSRARTPGKREVSSEEPFIRALARLREQYAGKSISTAALLRIFEGELPPSLWYEGRKSLDWFYQGWINGTAVPRLQLKGTKYVDGRNSTTISGTIVQSEAPDELVTLVPLYGTVAGKSVLVGQVFADGAETGFRITAPLGTRKVVLDPDRTILSRAR